MARIAAVAGLVLAVATGALRAQDRLDPETMGMSRSGVATVRGLGSIAVNPGSLDLPGFHGISLDESLTASLYTFGGTLGSTYLSSSEFAAIFGRHPEGMSSEQRQRAGDLLQDERLFANGGIMLVQARYRTPASGTFGIHYMHRVLAQANIPDSFALLIRTFNIGGSYQFVNRGVAATWATQLGLSYGLRLGTDRAGWLPSAGVGITVKLLQGVAHFDVASNSAISITPVVGSTGTAGFRIRGGYEFRSAQPENFDQQNAVTDFRAALFPGTAGLGFGGDIGISGVLYRAWDEAASRSRDVLFYGIVLQDIGSIAWNTRTFHRVLLNADDTLKTANITNEQFKNFEGTLEPTGDFTTTMPTVVRAGLGVDVGALVRDPATRLVAGIEAEAPMDAEAGNAEVPRLAFGAEWGAAEWLALRGGISFGGVSDFGVGLGVGVRPFQWLALDLGSSDVNGFFKGRRADVAIRLEAGLGSLIGSPASQ